MGVPAAGGAANFRRDRDVTAVTATRLLALIDIGVLMSGYATSSSRALFTERVLKP